jgi:hypothetical protein
MTRASRIFTALLLVAAGSTVSGKDGDPVCPLTDKQQTDALSAFDKLSPIFSEPRCINCHGKTSPFGAGVGTHPFAGEEVTCTDGTKSLRCPAGEEDFPKTFESCEECHSQITGGGLPKWRLAPSEKQWVDKSVPTRPVKPAVELCKLQKHLFPQQADRFVKHMLDDEGGVQFLDAAFAGRFALKDDSTVDKGVKWPDPPTMSRDDMYQNSVQWVDAMGQNFHDPDECGCVRLRYALRVKFHGTYAPTLQSVAINFVFDTVDSDADPALIPLTFGGANAGTVRGTGTLRAASSGSVQAGVAQCGAGGRQTIDVTVDGVWPALVQQPGTSGNDSAKMELQLVARDLLNNSEGTCTALGHGGSATSNRPGPDATAVNLSLDPVVGQTQVVPWNVPLPGWRGAVQVELVQIN